jgi:hypothetical protein
LGGVIYIGDRDVGKTHLALELSNQKKDYVMTSLDYDVLKRNLWDSTEGRTSGTRADRAVYPTDMEVKVKLVTGWKVIYSSWLDTPGDIWRGTWQKDNPNLFKTFLDLIKDTEGILLILPPYREIIDPQKDDPENHISRQQWIRRFNRWIDFFKNDCPRVRHLLLCLNKVDLCCVDYQAEAKLLKYKPSGQIKNWQEKHEYVYYRYFRPFHDQIQDLNSSIHGLAVRCFITTIHSRELLELPWIYLGSHLAQDRL